MPIILFHNIPIISPGASQTPSMQKGLYLSLEKEEEEGEGEIRVRPILPFPPERPLSSSYVSFLCLFQVSTSLTCSRSHQNDCGDILRGRRCPQDKKEEREEE